MEIKRAILASLAMVNVPYVLGPQMPNVVHVLKLTYLQKQLATQAVQMANF